MFSKKVFVKIICGLSAVVLAFSLTMVDLVAVKAEGEETTKVSAEETTAKVSSEEEAATKTAAEDSETTQKAEDAQTTQETKVSVQDLKELETVKVQSTKDEAAALLISTINTITANVNAVYSYEAGAFVPEGEGWITKEAYDSIVKAIEGAWDYAEKSSSYTADQLASYTNSLIEVYNDQFIAGLKTVKSVETIISGLIKSDDADGAISESELSAIIKDGGFFINGFALSPSKKDFDKDYPDGLTINENIKMISGSESDYISKCVQMIKELPAGTAYYLYDLDAKSGIDCIKAFVYEPVIVSEITENSDGTYSIIRSDVDSDETLVAYDGDLFKDGSEKIPADNFDQYIEAGDVAVAFYGVNGWEAQRGIEIKGVLTAASSDQVISLDGLDYTLDAEAVYANLLASNRADILGRALEYFSLTGTDEIDLWAISSADGSLLSSCGVFTGDNAENYLTKAIEVSKNCLTLVTVFDEEPEDPDSIEENWVTKSEYQALENEISEAEAVLDTQAESLQYEYQISSLYTVIAKSTTELTPGNYGHSKYSSEEEAKTEHKAKVLKTAELVLYIIFGVIALAVIATAVFVFINSRKKRVNRQNDGSEK